MSFSFFEKKPDMPLGYFILSIYYVLQLKFLLINTSPCCFTKIFPVGDAASSYAEYGFDPTRTLNPQHGLTQYLCTASVC